MRMERSMVRSVKKAKWEEGWMVPARQDKAKGQAGTADGPIRRKMDERTCTRRTTGTKRGKVPQKEKRVGQGQPPKYGKEGG